jgi:hypothetical protein
MFAFSSPGAMLSIGAFDPGAEGCSYCGSRYWLFHAFIVGRVPMVSDGSSNAFGSVKPAVSPVVGAWPLWASGEPIVAGGGRSGPGGAGGGTGRAGSTGGGSAAAAAEDASAPPSTTSPATANFPTFVAIWPDSTWTRCRRVPSSTVVSAANGTAPKRCRPFFSRFRCARLLSANGLRQP